MIFTGLHIRSTFSDSSRTHEEIVHDAQKKQVSRLSVCDHYTRGSVKNLFDMLDLKGLCKNRRSYCFSANYR